MAERVEGEPVVQDLENIDGFQVSPDLPNNSSNLPTGNLGPPAGPTGNNIMRPARQPPPVESTELQRASDVPTPFYRRHLLSGLAVLAWLHPPWLPFEKGR